MSKLTPEQRKRFDYLTKTPAGRADVKRHASRAIYGSPMSAWYPVIGAAAAIGTLLLLASRKS